MILTREQALEIFKRRVSVRYYDPARKISAKDFAAILDFGRLSPSSVGCEPWQFVVVQNAALREKIKPFAWGMQASISDASHVVFLLARKHARYDSPAFEELMDRRGLSAEERAGALERYRRFQTHDMPIADDERALFDWASKPTSRWAICLPARRCSASIPAPSKAWSMPKWKKSLPKPDCSILKITACPSPQPSATVCATLTRNCVVMRRKR